MHEVEHVHHNDLLCERTEAASVRAMGAQLEMLTQRVTNEEVRQQQVCFTTRWLNVIDVPIGMLDVLWLPR